MLDLKTLRQLIKLMTDNDLSELDLEDPKGEKIKLKRGGEAQGQVQYVTPAPAPGSPGIAIPGLRPGNPEAHAIPSDANAPGTVAADDGLIPINSPMVGTFYSASSPDVEPFAGVGTKVGADSVVCIVEAMKVFNEIKAEVNGTIEQILVENGQAVEFDQPLFVVRKS